MLNGKNVLLCVTGSIAAYKSSFIIRLLITSGASVKVIMTESAKGFITPLTLGTLSKNPVLTDFIKDEDAGIWNNHVDLGIWADLMLIAPATANTIAKMAKGEADSFLLATYLSAKCPVFVAPAMDRDMYLHGSTKDNLDLLSKRGDKIIQSQFGELASGLIGEGRLSEPEEIIESIINELRSGKPLLGKRIMVTAGPTFEPIDPVRFIGNRSSGKMGFALAEAAYQAGAEVTLITGPTNQQAGDYIRRIDVETAEDMYHSCITQFQDMQAVIMSAAIADYRPANVSDQKIKKSEGPSSIELARTKDVLHYMGENKMGQILVGFAMETENGIEHAKNKLKKKNLDFIVYNSINEEGAGFQHDTNRVTIIDKDNKITNFELKSKKEVAEDIINEILNYL